MIPSTLENPMIIPSYQISSWDHFYPMSCLSKQRLDQDHIYSDPPCLVHTYSNYNCVVWVKCDTSQSYNSILAILVVLIKSTL
jgi:hypothetical protein